MVPYQYLQNEDVLTVDNLVLLHSMKEEKRIPLMDLVFFNKERLKSKMLSEGQQYPYIEIKSIDLDTGDMDPSLVEGDNVPSRATLIARKGDVLLSTIRPDRGVLAIVPQELDGCLVSSAFVVLTSKNISSELLYLLLKDKDVREELGLMAQGTTIPRISLKLLKDYNLPIDSVPHGREQEAIWIYTNWKKSKKKWESLESVIEKVFQAEGLVEQSNEDDKRQFLIYPYEQLDDSWGINYYFSKVRSQVRWDVELVSLGEVTSITVGSTISSEEEIEEGLPYIQLKDLDDEELYIAAEEPVQINKHFVKGNERSQLNEGNILISRVGTVVGKSAMVQSKYGGAIANQYLVVLRPNSSRLLSKYLICFLKTSWAKKRLNTLAGDTIQKTLKTSSLKNFLLPLPLLEQQQRIVEQIETRLAEINTQTEIETGLFLHQIRAIEEASIDFRNGKNRGMLNILAGAGRIGASIVFIKDLVNAGVEPVLVISRQRVIVEQFQKMYQERFGETCNFIDSRYDFSDNEKVFVTTTYRYERNKLNGFGYILEL